MKKEDGQAMIKERLTWVRLRVAATVTSGKERGKFKVLRESERTRMERMRV